ncbi:MAG: cytochrome o ubiquinol oxidase subunit IV [Buchnera aphidicola (Nurudea shiraii)]
MKFISLRRFFSKNQYFFYILNFLILSILTIFPFFLVWKKLFSKEITYFLIVLCLVFQVFIHFKFFFHLNYFNEHKWNLISIIFSFLIIMIILIGSYWIMSNLNHNTEIM